MAGMELPRSSYRDRRWWRIWGVRFREVVRVVIVALADIFVRDDMVFMVV